MLVARALLGLSLSRPASGVAIITGLGLRDGWLMGIVMSGRRPLIKAFFAAVRLIVGAVMSSACRCGS
jgi:hypothetical protein